MRIRPTEPAREVVLREAGAAYFDVMRIPIVAGRPFDARDNAAAPPRVVVSQSLAEQWFPGEQSIGRQISLGPGPRAPMADIIGVADDVKHRSLDAEGFWPTVYAVCLAGVLKFDDSCRPKPAPERGCCRRRA